MNGNGSKPLQMSIFDWHKIAKGLGIGLAGAVLTWAGSVLVPALKETDNATLLLLAVVLAASVNAARKWLMDTTDG